MNIQTPAAITETLEGMIADSKRGPGNYGPTGAPWMRSVKIINGFHVQTNVFGWGEGTVKVWLNKSSEPLTIPEAVAKLAA